MQAHIPLGASRYILEQSVDVVRHYLSSIKGKYLLIKKIKIGHKLFKSGTLRQIVATFDKKSLNNIKNGSVRWIHPINRDLNSTN